jgi:hypothetical protein
VVKDWDESFLELEDDQKEIYIDLFKSIMEMLTLSTETGQPEQVELIGEEQNFIIIVSPINNKGKQKRYRGGLQ